MRVLSIPFDLLDPQVETVIGIGVFDGLHLGHQELLREVIMRAEKHRCHSVALTFSPHPCHLFDERSPLRLLEPLSQRLKQFSLFGLDIAAVAHFTRDFSRLSPAQFAKNVLRTCLRAKHVVVGENFRFGANQEGSIASLSEEGRRHGFEVHTAGQTTHNNLPVSSTRIRHLLAAGEAFEASVLLGRPYRVVANVISRPKTTRQLMGFALAQLGAIQSNLLPSGVYAASIDVQALGRFNGIFAICPKAQHEVFGAPAVIHLYSYHGPKFYAARVSVDVVGKLHEWPSLSDPMMWRTLVSADQARTLALNQRSQLLLNNSFKTT